MSAEREAVEKMLQDNPTVKYAVRAVDIEADPVVVGMGIQGVGTFAVAVPRHRYDGMALLELVEKRSAPIQSK